ncbi:EAL domain-containing protein [Ruminococcus albus]|uniref:EAL domain, c-di-GMP-specific phosphodiesterase class I (Or its enzymatically inactive variant) n=1 Tax=Ruminococcus albus TaxID=1264 RepID=A0A1I1D083_RUMAL|nr:EAL domain-containing protein [Ruminococcus albus]SFB68184.1 EAL domain, c-di-GMP-specific phosphodiesterase class I (or its enzymatically inactive variant) [Ruminococcus albus]
MNKKDIAALAKLFGELSAVRCEADLENVIEEGVRCFGDKDISDLKVQLYRLGGKMLTVDAENRDALRSRRIACLTDNEKSELQKVEEIINGNLLKYYFQPIVSAIDGEIFSYEALMRSAADPSITPYHILKYAGLSDRLEDIEKATFLNVLNIIESEKDKLGSKAVFINSIPNVRLGESDAEKISKLLSKNSDSAVVELTESAEADEIQLGIMKDRYRNMNIRIAVDDYGTGYSNVRNLLRYTPNFVKIDRSLLSEINSDPRKRHFVRDIIEFCHDNNILALAEGVETGLEMKTVILMGVDLIQGYYTARPSPELITSIPYEIKQEIKRYQQQRQDGKLTHVYRVESSERVLLDKIKRHGYKCIRILPSEENSDITIVGSSALNTNIHLDIDSGFKGRVTLESVHFSNTKNRPCIEIGENCEAELSIFGDCFLHNGGIIVPESSELTFTGVGSMAIDVHDSSFYGIGGPIDKRHGRLSFSANVKFIIEAYGQQGTCIGSGLGGEIDIHQGVFEIKMNSNNGVVIGSLTGNTDLDIRNCGMQFISTCLKGAVIGSRDADAELLLHGMSFKSITSGKETVCVGSVCGNANVTIDNSNFVSDVRSDELAVLGSLYNDSKVKLHNMSMNVDAGGQNAYIFGGTKGTTDFDCRNVDVKINLNSNLDNITSAEGENFKVGDGRYYIEINGEKKEFIPNI